jgi:2-iminobutanoate/2-iminopropanoate deaminase
VNTPIAPPTLAPPAANYSHAILSSGVTRLLHTSGVVPIALDGSVAESIDDQAVQVWANLSAILAEADMLVTDVVSVTTYVVVGELGALASVMAARDRALGGHRAASTLVTVPALARPEWKMEIALVAAA